MILILGSNGQLGQCLNSILSHETYFYSKDECNIEDIKNLEKVITTVKPSIIINCAAFTNVDQCESKAEKANNVNHRGPRNISILSNKYGFQFIHISTDYVFDGKKNTPYNEKDSTHPTSIYGKSKLAGENAITENSVNYIIIRTSWLYSEYSRNFVTNILKALKSKESIGIVYDQVGSPTYAKDLALAIKHIIETNQVHKQGIYHFANLGVSSWYDLASEVKYYFKTPCKIKAIESFEYPTPATRPNYSVLNSRKFIDTFNYQIPNWKESLLKCLKSLS